MAAFDPADVLTRRHPMWDQLIDAAITNISALLHDNEFVVYGLQHFADAVVKVNGADCLSFNAARLAYRHSLSHFCAQPIAVGKFYHVETLQEWALMRGIRGLVGLYPAGAATKVYLSDDTGLVLCRLELG